MLFAANQNSCTLQSLVGRLVAGIIPATIRNNSLIINNVPSHLQVAANPELVAGVLSNLFSTIAFHSTDSCIQISAKLSGNDIILFVKDLHSASTYTIAHCLESSQSLAEKIGGYVGITSMKKYHTTILFSFLNLPAAA